MTLSGKEGSNRRLPAENQDLNQRRACPPIHLSCQGERNVNERRTPVITADNECNFDMTETIVTATQNTNIAEQVQVQEEQDHVKRRPQAGSAYIFV